MWWRIALVIRRFILEHRDSKLLRVSTTWLAGNRYLKEGDAL